MPVPEAPKARVRKSEYAVMSARLLAQLEATGEDCVARDLIAWYEGEHGDEHGALTPEAQEELRQQLATVIRRLVKHEKQVVLVRSTVKGSKRVEDKVLRTAARAAAMKAAAELAPRPLLLLHGEADDLVPSLDARVMADAHGEAELRIIGGGGHEMRHDPRAIAVLLGWLARQHNAMSM